MNKKINIAICLSGEPRHLDLGGPLSVFNFRDNLKEYCNIDVFYYFWNNITKRQRHLLKEPIIETINSDMLHQQFNPTVGVCADKDNLNPCLDKVWEYVLQLKNQYNITDVSAIRTLLRCEPSDLEKTGLDLKTAFYQQIKTTNSPPLSQEIAICKSLNIMLDHAEENNIYYDIIIRSRSDVRMKATPYKKVLSVVRKDHLSRYVKFARMSVRTPRHEDITHHTPFAEYSFFIGSSKTIRKNMFKNYAEDFARLAIDVRDKKAKKPGFIYNSSHNCVPLFFKQGANIIGAPCTPFDYRVLRPNTYDTTSKRLWD